MKIPEMRRLLETDPDFIACKRFDYSIKKLMEKYPDGAPPKIVAQALMIDEKKLADLELAIVTKIRTSLGIDPD